MAIKIPLTLAWGDVAGRCFGEQIFLCELGVRRHVHLPMRPSNLTMVFTKRARVDGHSFEFTDEGRLVEVDEYLLSDTVYALRAAYRDGYRAFHFIYD